MTTNHDALREALEAAQKWIAATPHGDNCFVSDHYEGDPGNRCNCGKDAIERFLEEATVIPEQSVTGGRILVGKDEFKAALRTLHHCGMDAVAHGLEKSALSQPMPEAAAQGWKLVPVEPTKEMVKAAMPWALGDHAGVYRAMLSASPAAPEGANPEREIEQLIRERDQRDEIIDRLCDAVLGSERPEWSSAYGFDDAVADVEERIAQLHQPSVDKAWKRFEQANAAQPPHPQPQAQPTPSADDIHSCGEFCDLPECVAAREAQAQGGPQVLARIEKRFGGVRIVAGDGSPFDMAKYVGSQFITLQSHREAIAQHRAAMEESVEALRHLSQNARVSGAEMGLALVVAKDAITHANQVLEGKK